MNIHETIIFIHIYMPTHKHIHRYMYTYISVRLPIGLMFTATAGDPGIAPWLGQTSD